MKIFLSYRFTGEVEVELKETLGKILKVLRDNGHVVYCSIEDEEWFRKEKRTNGEIMQHAFDKIDDDTDLVLVFNRRDEKSEGMLMETGYAFGKGRKVALAIKRGVKMTSLPELADPVIEFDTIDELCFNLKVWMK